ncbi:hypothetical protein ES705_14807 [subsurface metagenome]
MKKQTKLLRDFIEGSRLSLAVSRYGFINVSTDIFLCLYEYYLTKGINLMDAYTDVFSLNVENLDYAKNAPNAGMSLSEYDYRVAAIKEFRDVITAKGINISENQYEESLYVLRELFTQFKGRKIHNYQSSKNE